jgi:hypothetical protein
VEPIEFSSAEELLAFVKQRADDIEQATIVTPGGRFVGPGGETRHFPDARMILDMTDVRRVLDTPAAEWLLNDGLLSRLRIRIRFA